jgi:hypothetical protein
VYLRPRARGRFLLQFDLIVINSGTGEIFQGTPVNLVALEEIARSPGIASEARVEQLVRIWEPRSLGKGKLDLSLWALPTAIIPSRDHTGLPIHFHSSMISRSAARILLRMLASVLPRQSVSPAISRSIRSDGFIGSLGLEFWSRFHASSFIG